MVAALFNCVSAARYGSPTAFARRVPASAGTASIERAVTATTVVVSASRTVLWILISLSTSVGSRDSWGLCGHTSSPRHAVASCVRYDEATKAKRTENRSEELGVRGKGRLCH